MLGGRSSWDGAGRLAGRGGRPFREESATTGPSAARSLGERWRERLRSPPCYSPRVRRPAGEPRNCTPPLPPPLSGRARAPASVGRVEDGLLAVCPDCRAGRPRVRSRAEAQGRWRIGRHPVGPVLKHGPRSLTCWQAAGLYETRGHNESEGRSRSVRGRIPLPPGGDALPARLGRRVDEAEREQTRWDPKDGELCLSRMKLEETLVEVRSDSDVQIDCRSWV